MFLPKYRAWVIVASLAVCLATWYVIERTKLGAYLRAGTENPALVQAFGINVPRMITLTYGFGVALAAFAGVMAAPIYQVSPLMGADLIIVVFAVVVIGGMGSILGSIITGFGLGVIEGLTKLLVAHAHQRFQGPLSELKLGLFCCSVVLSLAKHNAIIPHLRTLRPSLTCPAGVC